MEHNSPVSHLHPHQALLWLNRWTKLEQWTKEDRDALYNLKHENIMRWVSEGTMSPTKIIERDTIAVRGMKRQLLNQGADLKLLNSSGNSFNEMIEVSSGYEFYSTLKDFANKCHFCLLPADRRQELQQEYEQQKQAYYKQSEEIREFFTTNYAQVADAIIEVARTKPRTNQIIQWLKQDKLSERQISNILDSAIGDRDYFEIFAPFIGDSPKEFVKFPTNPSNVVWIEAETYVHGEVPEIDAALDWARQFSNNLEITLDDVNEDFIEDVIESALAEECMATLKELALYHFEEILSGETSSQDAYDSLVALELNYEDAIGMRCYWNRGEMAQQHGSYNKWHEINLSVSGYWLIEFSSNVDSSICLHVPYDLAKENINAQSLPHDFDESTFGRVITPEEKEIYPIADLLALLGKSSKDFPNELHVFCGKYDDWGDDWEDDDWDDDDWGLRP